MSVLLLTGDKNDFKGQNLRNNFSGNLILNKYEAQTGFKVLNT
jgi:hypothetical protein